jgi:RAD51-like protein 1
LNYIGLVYIWLPSFFFFSTCRSIAEFSQIPVVVTNQVRSQSNDDGYRYSFEVEKKYDSNNAEGFESHLVAALGIQWAHAVTIRLVFEAHSGLSNYFYISQ